MSDKARSIMFLVLASTIWGLSYPIGRQALETISPMALSGLRYFFGTLSLLPLVWRLRHRSGQRAYLPDERPYLWLKGGVIGGVLLSVGGLIQLTGMAHTTAGLASFLTSLYLLLVPVMAFVIGHLPRPMVWVSLGVGLAGLYFLTGGAVGGFSKSDGLVLVADVFWALQVLVTGRYALRTNPWLFSLAQAGTSCVLGLSLAVIFEAMPTWPEFIKTLPATGWGVFSVGVAYACQTLAQRHTSSTSAALILPFQAVVGALAGVVFLGEYMSPMMIAGAVILMGGSLLGQFAKEPIRLNRENTSRFLQGLRLGTGAALGGGAGGLLIWSLT